MQLRKYADIQNELENLSRRDQYVLLLSTSEWYNFRQKIMERDLNKCTDCGRKAGPIYEFRCSEEEYAKEREEVRRKELEYKKFIKENPKLWIEYLTTDNDIEIPFSPALLPRERQVGEVVLQVHHFLYFFDKLPWQYAFKNLTTLCIECHTRFHENNKVYVYKDESMEYRRVALFCWKCNGSGFLPEYSHIQNGVCFECNGLGFNLNESHMWEKVEEPIL